MKKLFSIALVLALMLALFAGCGGAGGNSGAAGSTAGNAGGDAGDDTAGESGEGRDLGVVLVVNTNLGDKSFCDLSHAGLQRAAEEFGLRIKVVELGGDTTKQIPTFTEFAEDPDWDLIVTGTYNVSESMQTVAAQYPEQMFILYDARVDDELDLPNVYSVEHLQNEGSFLAGAAAALLTNSDDEKMNDASIIGFVAGNQNTSIDDFMVGYIEGAKAVNEDIKVLISYIGSFNDIAKAKELGLAQINQGADVVFGVAGGAGMGVLESAREKGVYALGVDQDQATVLEETDPELAAAIATSMMKQVDNTVYNAVKGYVEGTLPFGEAETVGLAAGSVGIAKNAYYESIFSDEQKALLEELEQKVVDGEIVVPSALGMSNEEIQAIVESVLP